ncbi:MAG: redoxin domain-containing protein [Elainellaceae cyanobacterium]
MATSRLAVGEPAPWFVAACTNNPKFHFESVSGRYVVLCFLGSGATEASQQILSDMLQHRERFDDKACCFFGVSTDPEDEGRSLTQQLIPGIRFFWDFDQTLSQKFGVVDDDGTYRPCTYILDERLRVLAIIPFDSSVDSGVKTHVEQWIPFLSEVPEFPSEPASVQAPILVVPRIFEPDLCRALIDYYDHNGGEESGFMREVKGQTIHIKDHSFKRRRDQDIVDVELRNAAMYRIHDRLVPEIKKAFQFQVTRIERHIVACYDSTSGGFFKPHRDNTTKGTAHRRFAVTLNLNAEEYEGGALRFPEFGRKTYVAPTGGAVVFSCSLLHEATPVTQGLRYAYLPFLYDDEAASIRQKNLRYIADSEELSDKTESRHDQNADSKMDKPKGFRSKKVKSKQKRR